VKNTFQDCHSVFKMKHRRDGIGMLYRLTAGILATGIAALLMKVVEMPPTTAKTVQLLAWQNMPLFSMLSQPDPAVEAIIRQYLKTWGTKGAGEANQAVWIQSGLTVLADSQGNVPLPAASLTKIATTLAALEKWGPSHRFETIVSATGPIKNGVLQGDLVITGGGDPFFVWEEAIALGNSLNQMGIRRVAGNLIVNGDFYVNYEENPVVSAQLLRQAFNSKTWSRGFVYRYSLMPPKTPKPQVAIAGGIKVATIPLPKKFLLLRHQSLPLDRILREMNIHSNNHMADMLTKSLGGPQVRTQLAARSAGISLNEIQLINGSGLGVENRMSARAACALLMGVDRYLQSYNLDVAHVFPLAGRDEKQGTMYGRKLPVGTAMKTGTLRDVSALAGVIPTRDRGKVWFVIMNRGNDVLGFRAQQDQLVESLSKHWGTLPSTISANPTEIYRLLGDPKRNEKVLGTQTKKIKLS
jgi:serine-type D-Ala-D-Ala carboxypeptidase/endopeptidase (penicillin-binding protein 4)